MLTIVHNASTMKKAHMICVLRSRGLSWDKIGDRMDLSRERCRQIYEQIVPLAVELLRADGYTVEKGQAAAPRAAAHGDIECRR